MSETLMCLDCAKDTKLKKYFFSKTLKNGVCTFCKKSHHSCLDIDNDEFANIARALIRYHYYEVQYNRHFGGLSLSELFLEENEIFHSERLENKESVELLVSILENYQHDSDDIPLYNNDGTDIPFMSRIQDNRDEGLTSLEKELLEKSYFLLEEEFLDKLKDYTHYFEHTLGVNDTQTLFFRARMGCEGKCKGEENLFSAPAVKYSQRKYTPYREEAIGAPPVSKLTQNRLNRIGTSYLYLATDIETALSELRPEPGDKISIGCFRPIQMLKMADFESAFIKLASSQKTLGTYTYINHIDQLLSRLVKSDKKYKYLVTQFFSDAFRKLGFDGIYYSSSLTGGQNLLIYNPDNFEYIEYESSVYTIESVQYKYERLQTNGIPISRNKKSPK